MAESGPGTRSPWAVPIIVAIIGAAATITVALINRCQPAPPEPPPSTASERVVVTGLNAVSHMSYFARELGQGASVYSDRDYVYDKIPPFLMGETYIMTSNEDKFREEADFLRFEVDRDATVYVAYDHRWAARPSWLNDFQDTGVDLAFPVGGTVVTLRLYERQYHAGQIVLGANFTRAASGGNYGMYTVVVSD